jgi:transposase-like protein
VYLSGTNTRRLRGALAPLLRGAPLSKDAVSRLVGRLRDDFEAWTKRDLGELRTLSFITFQTEIVPVLRWRSAG